MAPRRLLTIVALFVLAGCSNQGLDKVTVVGEATYDGHLIVNGDILFEPLPGTKGPSASAPIVNGRYEAKYKGGVPVGEHRVVLQAFILENIGPAAVSAGDMLSGVERRTESKPSIPTYRFGGRDQFLPPVYNQRSPLTVHITGEENPQVEDFHMKSAQK